MSDREHLSRLADGVQAWNAWRRAHPGIRPDLSGSHVRVRRLAGVDLREAQMRRVLLPGADLAGADLRGADLSGADLMEADLRGARLCGADLRGANLMGADLEGADLEGADLEDAILIRTGLERTEGVCHSLWLRALMEFADGLRGVEGAGPGFEFEDVECAVIESSHLATSTSRIDIELCDPISTRAATDMLGALNRLYSAVADQDLPGPIIMIGAHDGEERP
jgi:uncharacterized protein YjbI with pentapeptide repeats